MRDPRARFQLLHYPSQRNFAGNRSYQTRTMRLSYRSSRGPRAISNSCTLFRSDLILLEVDLLGLGGAIQPSPLRSPRAPTQTADARPQLCHRSSRNRKGYIFVDGRKCNAFGKDSVRRHCSGCHTSRDVDVFKVWLSAVMHAGDQRVLELSIGKPLTRPRYQ